MLVGRKSNNQGYVFAPYIPVTTVSTISGSFSQKYLNKISSRYSIIKSRNEIRKEKIKNIYEIDNPTE